MVMKGKFIVELVDAATKRPFPEYSVSSGLTYVEVEPDTEYFIRVENNSDDAVKWRFYVDEQDLRYCVTIQANRECYCGIMNISDGRPYCKALKISKLRTATSCSNEGADLWTGQIEAKVFRPSLCVESSSRNISRPSTQNVVEDELEGVAFLAGLSHQKRVKSTAGSTAFEVNGPIVWKSCKSGADNVDLIEEVELIYCSTVGLIFAGVLPKPPMWDYARMITPVDTKISKGGKELKIEPEILVHQGVGDVIERKEYELFDLSHLSDSDSEEDKQLSEAVN